MRPALLALCLIGCGQPEDLLKIQGEAVDILGLLGPVELTLYRDLGATELGCTAMSPWQTLTPGDDGKFSLTHVRQETAGRFGPPRCLRLEWAGFTRSSSLSWLGRARDTQLPSMPLTPIGDPPALPTEKGGVTAPLPSYEISDERGVIFRQSLFTDLEPLLAGPGPSPGTSSTLTLRVVQRGQQAQPNELGQEPYMQYEYRVEARSPFSGNAAHVELAHGRPCNVQHQGTTVCALTDGMFEPIDVPGAANLALDVLVGQPVRTVVVRGIGSTERWAAVVVESVEAAGPVPGGRLAADPAAESLATGTLEDERQGAYVVVHWTGPPGPVERLRVRLEDAMGNSVPIGWVSEISVY